MFDHYHYYHLFIISVIWSDRGEDIRAIQGFQIGFIDSQEISDWIF